MIITKRTATVAVTALLTLSGIFVPALAAAAATAPTSPVIDGGDMLSAAQERSLTQAIDSADKRYKLEFVVETIPALNGRDIKALATSRANELGVGSEALNNGVYTLIARDDHGIQIALGSGVEGKVSNGTVEQIIADDMTPAFRENDYVGGIEAAQAEIGSYYSTDRAAKEAAAQRAADAENQRVGASITHWLLLILGGIVALAVLGGLIWLARRLIEYVQVERERKARVRHREAIEALTGELHDLTPEREAEFHALPNDEARKQWLAPRIAAYTVKDEAFADELYEGAMRAYTKVWTSQIEKETNMRWTHERPYKGRAGWVSLAEFFTKFRADSEQEKERQRREAKRLAEERERQRAAAAERARVAAKQKAQQEADAKRAWKQFTPEQKAAVKRARTRREKERVLTGYGVASGDLNIWFPIWLATYASEVGQPQSDYSSHSHHSSSSSSSYGGGYSSGSDFGSASSFGGGSFDGGGGGGSW